MARPKGGGKGATKPITMRLPPEEENFYRSKANKHGISLSEFLRRTLYEGVIAENVQDAEARMQALIATIPANARAAKDGLSDDLALSLLTCEAMLSAIVQAQSIQVFYSSQDAAKAKLARIKETPK
jgi:hypothetical protein